ncbi:MAG: 2,4-dienoyl-CoA reductase, partial [Enterococcus sp.]
LMEVQKDRFIVEDSTGKIEELPFDLGFICLGMRANAPLIPELATYAQQRDVTLLNIGDSKVARRIMEGTREARDIVKVIKNLEAQRVSSFAASY